jgi:putative membrane protein
MVREHPPRVPRREAVIEDRLAMDLTSLSNERTLLMYIRTALGFFAAGAALIRFFEDPVFVFIGWIFIPVGIAFLVFGIFRYRHVQRVLQRQWGLRSMEDDTATEQEPDSSRHDHDA